MKKALLVLTLAAGTVLAPIAVLLALMLGSGGPPVFDAGALRPGSVPPEYEAWVIKAGSMCPEVSPSLIAAQIEVESGWNPNAVSPAGAQGFSQFMPYTWPTYGRDEDGNGRISPFDPADAIMAQGRFDCASAAQATKDIESGRISGELLDIILVSYNCGYGCILDRGSPYGTAGGAESDSYPGKVKAAISKYTLPGAPRAPNFIPGGPFGANIVAAALAQQGLPYAWGGGDANGPTQGIRDGSVADSFGDYNKVGFDCSGLVTYAVAQASGHAVVLPSYTVHQLNDPRGQPVPVDQLQPGDVVFPAGGNPQHVAIYIGEGVVVAAPQSGDVVKVQPMAEAVGANPDARRFG